MAQDDTKIPDDREQEIRKLIAFCNEAQRADPALSAQAFRNVVTNNLVPSFKTEGGSSQLGRLCDVPAELLDLDDIKKAQACAMIVRQMIQDGKL